MLLESAYRLLESIPAIFYAITTGSTITLAGLYMQNRSESERNTERLRHDALMRDREREMTLKREVYLHCADALAHAQDYLAAFAHGADERREALVQGIGADLNKVHIVGSLATVQAIVAANEFFVRSVADLCLTRLPVHKLREEIHAETQALERASARRDEALAHLHDMDQAGTADSAFWVVQKQVLADAQAAIEVSTERMRASKADLAAQEARLLRESAQAGMAFGALVVRANVAIRRELELPLDADAYFDLMARSQEALARHVDQFHNRALADRAGGAKDSPRQTFTRWLAGVRPDEHASPKVRSVSL
ncbi:MAG: hypothetical protein M0Z76_08760 [Gammaproteobacteria bacterium]|nr:hypothetical protein [Gammaproteobacteria bacterium]